MTAASVARREPVLRAPALLTLTSLFVASLVVAASVAGLALGANGLYGDEVELLPAFLGQDLLNLTLGLPVLLGAMWLARRGSAIASVLWPGALFYFVYDYGYYVLGAPSDALLLVYLVIVTLSAYTTVGLLVSIDAEAVRRDFARIPHRVTGGGLVAVALLFVALWTALTLAAATSGSRLDPIPRSVVIMDFAVQLPALLVGGVLLWRRQDLGYVVAPGLLLQAATYLLGLSAICILGRDPTGALVTPMAYMPGLIVGSVFLALIGFFVRSAEGHVVRSRVTRVAAAR